MTDLEWARIQHEQAKRWCRRIEQERKVRRSARLDRDYDTARERCRVTLARLQAAEAMEQPAAPASADGERRNDLT